MNKNIDISNVTLRTERLLLRPWRESDLDDFFEYASVDGVGQMAGWLPHKSKEESLHIMNMTVSSGRFRLYIPRFQADIIQLEILTAECIFLKDLEVQCRVLARIC